MENEGNKKFWQAISQHVYSQVAEDHPITDDTPTRINSNGEVVNMSKEAMLARIRGFADAFIPAISEDENG